MLPRLLADLPGLATVPAWLLLAKATLILLAALGITVAMQRASAGARHLVWLVTLGTLLLVPALAAWAPLRVEILPAPPAPVAAVAAVAAIAAPARPVANVPLPDESTIGAGATSAPRADRASWTDAVARASAVTLLAALWAAVVLGIVGWLAWGALAVRRIVRHARPLDTSDWTTPLIEVSDRLALEEPPRLLASDEARMPFACGFLAPTIVLPRDCEAWTTDRRHAVLLHELAHVKRRDLVGHTLGRLACAFWWFHPLVWTAAKRLRAESERACDDLALASGARASDYAEHLLDIVTSVRRDSTPAVALAMARRREFEGRMLAILDPELRRSTPSRRQTAALVATLGAIALVVGAAAPARRAAVVARASNVPGAVEARRAPAAPTPSALAVAPERQRGTPVVGADSVPTRDVRIARRDTAATPGIEVEPQVSVRVDERMEQQVNTVLRQDVVQSVDGDRARMLATKSGRDDRPLLLAKVLAADTSAALRRIAAWGLAEYAESDVASSALATAVRKDANAVVREMAAWALADGRGAAGVDALGAALRGDADVRVRATAAWALGELGERSAAEPLVAALADTSAAVRARVVWALGNVDLKEAPPALVAQLKDPSPRVRELAAWALYNIQDPQAAPALQAALAKETDKDLQISYIRALAAMGERSVDAIRGLLESSDPQIKSMAVRALAGGRASGPWPWPWPEPRPYP